MKHSMMVLAIAGLLAGAGAHAAGSETMPPQLQKLDVATGQWVFHGKSLATPYSKAGTWTWHEDCRWSGDRIYLLCTFANEWSGQAVKSLVVDTWNGHDKSYWHYEMFSAGASGKHPFSSRMTINGNVWTEYGSDESDGKKTRERIVYTYAPPDRVRVEIRVSADGTHWTTVDRGEGVKRSQGGHSAMP